jgi:hypothetical protein
MMAMRALLRTSLLSGALSLPAMCNVYKSDVNKLCSAEQLTSGTLKSDRQQVLDWMGRTVASSEGVLLVKDLSTRDTRSIGVTLRDEARKVGLPACPLADQCDALSKQQDYETDIANLCAGNAIRADGSIARLDVLGADDAERIREITTWVSVNAKSPDTAAIVAKLAAVAPRQRGPVMRAEGAKVNVASCLLASVLDASPPPVAPPPLAAYPSYSVVKIEGPMKNPNVLAQMLVAPDVAAAINACYAASLATAPTLTGKAVLKLTIEAPGSYSKVVDDGSSIKAPVVACITGVLGKLSLGQPLEGKKPIKETVTLALTPTPNALGGATIDLKGHHH